MIKTVNLGTKGPLFKPCVRQILLQVQLYYGFLYGGLNVHMALYLSLEN